MADEKLSALTEVTSSADADLLYTVQNGNSRKTTRAKVLAPAVRHDIDQALLTAAKEKARQNISAAALDTDGIVPRSQLPDSLFAGTGTVDSEAAMLALDVPVGFTAVRTDIDKNFVLNALPASTLANWVELASPTAPVLSVSGKQGDVELQVADIIGLDEALSDLDTEKLDNPSGTTSQLIQGDGSLVNKSALPVSTAVQTALNNKLSLSGGQLEGGLLFGSFMPQGNIRQLTTVTLANESVVNLIVSGLLIVNNLTNGAVGLFILGGGGGGSVTYLSQSPSFGTTLGDSGKINVFPYPIPSLHYEIKNQTGSPVQLAMFLISTRAGV